MMNPNNSNDNHNPNDGNNRPIPSSRDESLMGKISSITGSIEIRPNDVLCGRSKASFNHVGNRRFRSIVTSSLEEYNDASSKWAKSMVAARLVGLISSEGGRFLKQKKGHGEEWYELSAQEAKAKVSHAIRDAIAAKDKTKASRGDPTSTSSGSGAKKKDPPAHFGKTGEQIALGSGRGSGSQAMVGQQVLSSSLSLTSMAQPIFSMGGPQHFGLGGNTVQDQLQNLQRQGLGPSANPSLFGLGGTGTGFTPQLMQQQQQQQQPHRRHSHQPTASHRGGPTPNMPISGRSSLPPNMPGLPSSFHDSFPLSAARARQVEESKLGRGSGSGDTEDGDTEFLSLIDTVLGPAKSPKGPQGRKG